MKKILYVFLITCFSLTIFSCAKKDGSSGTATSFWSEQIGTSSYDYGTGVTLYSSENIYVSGKSNGGLDQMFDSRVAPKVAVKKNSSYSAPQQLANPADRQPILFQPQDSQGWLYCVPASSVTVLNGRQITR